MAQEFTAQVSMSKGRWRLYVALLNAGAAPWPEFSFERAEPVPTFTERADALSVLGYEPIPGAEWRWTEYSDDPDDPSSPVVLIAAIRVRSRTGVSV
jgi:hypothetical protein